VAVILDSGVIIGFLDGDDAHHDAAKGRVRQLLNERQSLCASVITLAEVLTGAELGHHDRSIVVGFFDRLVAEVYDVDRAVAERASELRGRKKSLKMPDALILATADTRPEVELVVCTDAKALRTPGLDCRVEGL
jgi:predicted nucleic acid-binding protein